MHKSVKPAVVFFGSGPVAAKSLELLIPSFDIVAVITKPKPPHHRGSFPVIDLATSNDLEIFTVSNRSELSKLISKQPFATNLAILIDFGIIVSQDVIDYFPKGIVNSHFSLLPQWRGADPISFAILSGQKQTGISLMLLVEAMDEGPLLAQATYDITDKETTPSLTEALIELSTRSLESIVPLWLEDKINAVNQEDVSLAPSKIPSYSRKLAKLDGTLDFNRPAEVLECEIRAFIEWPKSRTTLADIDVIITSAHTIPDTSLDSVVGTITVIKEAGTIMITTSEGLLCIDKLKPSGKKEITAKEFISGYSNRLVSQDKQRNTS